MWLSNAPLALEFAGALAALCGTVGYGCDAMGSGNVGATTPVYRGASATFAARIDSVAGRLRGAASSGDTAGDCGTARAASTWGNVAATGEEALALEGALCGFCTEVGMTTVAATPRCDAGDTAEALL